MSRKRAFFRQKAVRAVTSHPEFVGCAVVAALVGHALVTTDWMPCSRQPHEIADRVSASQAALGQSVWPDSERGRFMNVASTGVASIVDQRLYARIPLDSYESGPFSGFPGRRVRLQEPELESVQYLIATPGRVLIELRPARETVPTTSTPVVEDQDSEPWEDEFLRRGAVRDRRDVAEAMPWYDTVTSPGDESSGMRSVSREGRGYPFVAVRGLFDVSTQITAFAEATLRNRADAEKRLEMIDFYLERQTFDRKRNAWGDWEPVDVQVFRDLALLANGFEPDVVPSAATDTVITCPLLMRVTGRWQTLATHPRLQSGQLSAAEMERETRFHQAILALQNEARQPQRAAQIEQRGFTGLLLDARRLEADLFDPVLSSSAAATPQRNLRFPFAMPVTNRNLAAEDLVRRIAERMDPKQTDRALRDWISNRMTQGQSRQLLFRYFDYNVEPGATYRYQVRLELRNPNFGRSLAAASASHVVQGETRLTPWSEPTDAVTVRRNVHYFLAGLEDARQRQYPWARLNVFQYDTGLGTVVQQELPVEFGQQIAGTARAVQLDPATGVMKEEDYNFQSRDRLLDALPDLAFDRSLHADLQLPSGSLGAAHILEYALVLADDELRAIDPRTQADELARQLRYVDAQRDQLQHLRSRTEQVDGWENEYERMMYEEVFGQPGAADDDMPQPRQRNILQRRR